MRPQAGSSQYARQCAHVVADWRNRTMKARHVDGDHGRSLAASRPRDGAKAFAAVISVNPHPAPRVLDSINRPICGNSPMNPDQVRAMFAPRKQLTRSSSSSSISSNSSNTTIATNGSQPNGTPLSANTDMSPTSSDMSQWSNRPATGFKRPPPKHTWLAKSDSQPDLTRGSVGRPSAMVNHHAPLQLTSGQLSMAQQTGMRAMGPDQFPPGQPVLFLLSLNGTFERKTIAVPFAPESLRIGRQTNQKTVPTPTNGFFDSKVLSRQHAEIYAERNGKVYIRDVKSSNGTFVNGTRLSLENRESDPHELQTADHLELGIDIVSEDQKTVVHHKVAAKVEHAGFLSNTSNVLDMNFGDLDPANGTMLVPNCLLQMRGRAGNNASVGNNGGRMVAGGGMMASQNNALAQQQRPFFVSPIATEQILKRLTNEMRNVRLQSQDLNRMNVFVNRLLSKDDVKDLEKSDMPEPSKPIMNGSGIPFRTDGKNRFSDPPAPPPQQPLPEKPDVLSLKRGPGERPRISTSSPASLRQENLGQVIQLTEALNNVKRDMESQSVRVRELEMMLQKEREARELAEELARRFEESANDQTISATPTNGFWGSAYDDPKPASDASETNIGGDEIDEESYIADDADLDAAPALQSRIDTMERQMRNLREQMEMWKQRCETAETERDEGRQSLADMVVRLRAEEAKRHGETSRGQSRRGRSGLREQPGNEAKSSSGVDGAGPETEAGAAADVMSQGDARGDSSAVRGGGGDGGDGGDDDDGDDGAGQATADGLRERYVEAALPYASMLGVVLIGMSLMAYINGWQPPSPQME
ncbi:cytoplasm to vacuole targeting Vps64 [Ophiocordyceps camponoti-floridani]|uniref:Cytoplasm to vacuole targeting Vps64 n=1 Tax=Ophiocordyceps camponoti-floridani TaxID=2030778 RepID=A0A8H4Q649_9HYPO|nr:cytoplasm to vacuole targeting Vps64 [Ophiocordyceps camponoti-floridani]